nr:MAG TPA: hypothetical protein [Caudoviricetes sp.]
MLIIPPNKTKFFSTFIKKCLTNVFYRCILNTTQQK